MTKEKDHKEYRYSLLREYFMGMSSQQMERQIIEWTEDPSLQFKLRQGWHELWKETDEESVASITHQEDILNRIHHQIHLDEAKTPGRTQIPNRSHFSWGKALRTVSRIAAVLLLPLLVYLAWEVIDQKMWLKSQNRVAFNELVCPLGSRSRFELPDGTSGWLNSGSRLQYPSLFTGDAREVKLSGEAYFDVRRSGSRAFVVKTGGVDVKVLGTKLNVKAYPDDSFQTFTLESGEIELIRETNGSYNQMLKMEPGQHAVYWKSANELDIATQNTGGGSKKPVDFSFREDTQNSLGANFETVEQFTSWKDGKLVLRNDPLPFMLRRIERWYNVKFHYNDPELSNYRYWATFEEESLDKVLLMLSLTGPVRFEKLPLVVDEDGTYQPQEFEVKLIK